MFTSSATTAAAIAFALLLAPLTAHAADPQNDELEISADPKKAPAAAPGQTQAPASNAPPTRAELDALKEEITKMRAELDEHRAHDRDETPKPASTEPSTPEAPQLTGISLSENIALTGYFQGQYESHQDSQDQLFQGGALENQDRFVLRRMRLHLIGEWKYAATYLELDGNTVKGPSFGLQRAEASLQYRPDITRQPLVKATIGQFLTPFGFELEESPRTRLFMERTQGSRAFWPSEPDVGARFSGGVAFFRWTIAALNGHPLGDKYPLQSPISAKDVSVRLGVETKPRGDLSIAGNVSALRGKGFHPGTDATKGGLTWHDTNEDGVAQSYEIQGVAPGAATPSLTFDRWVVGADVEVQYTSTFGKTSLRAEGMIAQNMDRGMFIADPITTSIDSREIAWSVGITQDVTKYGAVGFRYDLYDPNSDAFDKRQGRLLPYSQQIKTFSPVIALILPERAKLVFQYDVIRNALGRDLSGVPANLKMNTFTLRLQVQL